MRVVIVTDAWFPQVNGVVRTLHTLTDRLTALGDQVTVIAPERFRTIPCPSYPEIRLALAHAGTVGRLIIAAAAEAIHIATEGPLGLAARAFCLSHRLPFTTSVHTRFPEYIHARWRLPVSWGYAFMRWFHRPAANVMVSTPSFEQDLAARGFINLKRWSRGVDTDLFYPRPKEWLALPRPVSLFVGRVAVEKNIAAFLSLDLPGSKVVVGDGPQLSELKRRFPSVHFVGMKHGEDLARYYAAADVFVFPSLTDTFGLVLLEALASGVPVAAYPVTGPRDVLDGSAVGCLDPDLGRAVRSALTVKPQACRAFAERFSWQRSVAQFRSNLVPFAQPMAARAGRN
jgi:glycosyltransferase involved in cell wall biosynthesis